MTRTRCAVRWTAPVALLLFLFAISASAQQLTPVERAQIDSAAKAVLAGTGAPSASIAVVRGGAIVYEQAYGEGRLGSPATTSQRYAIGSVSKQFTATAVMLLAEQGKLSLDDKVAKWYPALTRADEVSIRQLLSMTSGYQDYWPQDYVFSAMQLETTPNAIMQRWGKLALDFDPGTAWQYSNTNYVIAASIVEKVSGAPFMDFLKQKIFTPLHLNVADFDAGPLGPSDAGAYLRYAIGPLRPAPKEGPRWLFGAGQLAMTAHDLATWNLAMINQTILKPASYRAQQTAVTLANGTGTGYGLGINVAMAGKRKRLSHGGAVSGYTTTNIVYPEDRAAITVFTNIYPGGSSASGQLAGRIANIMFAAADSADAAATVLARKVYDGLSHGTIDRGLFTPNASAFFSDQAVADFGSSLGPLGAPTDFSAGGSSLRGGLRIRGFRIRAGSVNMNLTMMVRPDGLIEQYMIERDS